MWHNRNWMTHMQLCATVGPCETSWGMSHPALHVIIASYFVGWNPTFRMVLCGPEIGLGWRKQWDQEELRLALCHSSSGSWAHRFQSWSWHWAHGCPSWSGQWAHGRRPWPGWWAHGCWPWPGWWAHGCRPWSGGWAHGCWPWPGGWAYGCRPWSGWWAHGASPNLDGGHTGAGPDLDSGNTGAILIWTLGTRVRVPVLTLYTECSYRCSFNVSNIIQPR